jgi:hypothetical protein
VTFSNCVQAEVCDGFAGDPFEVDSVGTAGAENLDDHGTHTFGRKWG